MSAAAAEEEGALDPALVEAVLERLGFAAAPAPDRAGLTALYRSWCRRVPFDNVRKRIHLHEDAPGPLPGDTPAAFFADWLRWGAGGTCWAGNGALAALLASLGFRARRVLSTMLVAPDLPPNHGSVRVELEDGEPVLVDASILFDEPLPLAAADGARIDHPAWGVAFEPGEALGAVAWRPFHMERLACRLDRAPATAAEFRERHEATRGWSPFNFQLSARLLREDDVVGVAFGRRAEIDAGGRLSVRDFEPGERLAFLVETLGIAEALAARLPEDVAMPPPPRS